MTTSILTAHIPARTLPLTHAIRAAIARWLEKQRRVEEDSRYWQSALNDPRVMADIRCAMARAESGRR